MLLRPKEENNEAQGNTGRSLQNTTGAESEVAGWGPRSQRQTKSVWHSDRNGPMACILNGVEKAPESIGGLFRHLTEKRGRGDGRRGLITIGPCTLHCA